MTLDYRRCEEMYRTDATFNRLVTTLEMALETCTCTPADIRAAAMFAATRFQMRHPPTIAICLPDSCSHGRAGYCLECEEDRKYQEDGE